MQVRRALIRTARSTVNPSRLAGLLALAVVNTGFWLLILTAACHFFGASPGAPLLVGLSVPILAMSFVGFARLMPAPRSELSNRLVSLQEKALVEQCEIESHKPTSAEAIEGHAPLGDHPERCGCRYATVVRLGLVLRQINFGIRSK